MSTPKAPFVGSGYASAKSNGALSKGENLKGYEAAQVRQKG